MRERGRKRQGIRHPGHGKGRRGGLIERGREGGIRGEWVGNWQGIRQAMHGNKKRGENREGGRGRGG